MLKVTFTRACVATILLAAGAPSLAQNALDNLTVNVADPALDVQTTNTTSDTVTTTTTADSMTVNTAANDPLVDPLTTTNTVEPDDDDNDFPWGLLGLLGLAGLLGRKRRDDDIHVDARRNTRS